jgi:hypothetical protein
MIWGLVIKFFKKQVRSVLINKGNFEEGSGKNITLKLGYR